MKLCIYWPLKSLLIGLFVTISCTKDPVQPEGSISQTTIITADPSDISTTSAVSGGTINDNGIRSITARGICWSTDKSPTIANNHTRNGSGSGIFSSTLKDLSPATTYYIRAYATNEAGTFYGDEKQFSTSPVVLSAISTAAVSEITLTSAKSGGTISNTGGGNVTERGLCWSTSENPTVSNSSTKEGKGSGTFTSTIAGLAPATTYYVRAYAINESGTAYGNQVQFTTASRKLADVNTLAVSNILQTSALGGGNVTGNGGGNVSERGICWSTSPNPTINSSRFGNGSGVGEFAGTINGLSPSTTYYVRAYATNEVGTAYGNQVQFTTLGTASNIFVSTLPVSQVNRNSAKSGGTVTAVNSSEVVERGVCWSIGPDPTINNSRSRDGSGAGIFTSDIKNLNPNTVYFVRAYAVTANGVRYGSQHQFQTRNNGNGSGGGNDGDDDGDDDDDDDGDDDDDDGDDDDGDD